jgi:hypothetical protein
MGGTPMLLTGKMPVLRGNPASAAGNRSARRSRQESPTIRWASMDSIYPVGASSASICSR